MPINPIDFATMAPKSQEVSQIQHGQNHLNQHAVEQAGAQVSQNVMHDSQTTKEMDKSEWPEYQYGQGKGSQGNQRERQRKEKKEDEAPKAPTSTSSFDIKI